jgi:hypothetical protein
MNLIIRAKKRISWPLLALACTLLVPVGSLAQQYHDPGLIYKPVMRAPKNYSALGMRLGSWVLSPAVDFMVEAHDNIYYERDDKTDDVIYHIRPKLALSSTWSRHSLSLSADADFARHADRPSEDYNDARLTLDSRIDVQRGQYFTLQATTMLLHEERGSPEDPGGIEPAKYDFNNYSFGYHHTFNRLSADLNYTLRVNSYDSTLDEDGNIIDNSDRDRRSDSIRARLDYQVAPQRAVFLSVATSDVLYDQETDNDGLMRSSSGYTARGGVVFDITGKLNGEVWLNYLVQDYDDPTFGKIDDVGLGASLYWTPTRTTDVSLLVSRTTHETIQSDTAGYLSVVYSVRVQHEFRGWLLGHASVSYTDNDYLPADFAPPDVLKETQFYSGSLGLSYLINRHLSMTAGYRYEQRDANLSDFQFEANRFFLVLSLAR